MRGLEIRKGPESFFPEETVPELIDGVAAKWVNPYFVKPHLWYEASPDDLDLVLVAEANQPTSGRHRNDNLEVPAFVRSEPLMTIAIAPETDELPAADGTTFARRELLQRILRPEAPPVEMRTVQVSASDVDQMAAHEGQLCFETPEMAEFATEFTRVELITRLAERYADSHGKLPTMWELERIMAHGLPRCGLLQDVEFTRHLKGYQAGREAFVAHVKDQMKHPRFATEVLLSAARAQYLAEYQTDGLIAIVQNQEVTNGETA